MLAGRFLGSAENSSVSVSPLEEQSAPAFAGRHTLPFTLLKYIEEYFDDHTNRYRLSEPCAGSKTPLPNRRYRLIVQAKDLVQGFDNLYVTHRAIRQYNCFDPHYAVNLGAHRVGGVLSLDLMY